MEASCTHNTPLSNRQTLNEKYAVQATQVAYIILVLQKGRLYCQTQVRMITFVYRKHLLPLPLSLDVKFLPCTKPCDITISCLIPSLIDQSGEGNNLKIYGQKTSSAINYNSFQTKRTIIFLFSLQL